MAQYPSALLIFIELLHVSTFTNGIAVRPAGAERESYGPWRSTGFWGPKFYNNSKILRLSILFVSSLVHFLPKASLGIRFEPPITWTLEELSSHPVNVRDSFILNIILWIQTSHITPYSHFPQTFMLKFSTCICFAKMHVSQWNMERHLTLSVYEMCRGKNIVHCIRPFFHSFC